ncbi:MAG: hypothetical protein KatS3mg130_0312 [Candidatus Sumerlaea sp.]|nr:MAG: hypothetical protein KatS3mg130_0312 [Candidatus Sumerlaea sp.]
MVCCINKVAYLQRFQDCTLSCKAVPLRTMGPPMKVLGASRIRSGGVQHDDREREALAKDTEVV